MLTIAFLSAELNSEPIRWLGHGAMVRMVVASEGYIPRNTIDLDSDQQCSLGARLWDTVFLQWL